MPAPVLPGRETTPLVSYLLTYCKRYAYIPPMIVTFKNKGLAEIWSTGKTRKIDARMHPRILTRLDRLNVAMSVTEMNVPGFDFHPLKGFVPTRYSVHVNGPWRLTFAFEGGDAYSVDFEQYH